MVLFGSVRAHCIALDLRMVSQPERIGAKTARDCQQVQTFLEVDVQDVVLSHISRAECACGAVPATAFASALQHT